MRTNFSSPVPKLRTAPSRRRPSVRIFASELFIALAEKSRYTVYIGFTVAPNRSAISSMRFDNWLLVDLVTMVNYPSATELR